MNLSPAELLRLSKAAALAEKHMGPPKWDHDANEWHATTEQIAALVDEAVAAKEATITRLRAILTQVGDEGMDSMARER
jgi:hypothetical protein